MTTSRFHLGLVLLAAAVPLAQPAAAQDDPVPMLIEKLQHSDSFRVRTQAAAILGRLRDERAVGPLVERLRADDSYAVRGAAAGALGHIGGPRAVDPLFVALFDSDPLVRATAESGVMKLQGDGVAEVLKGHMQEGNEREQHLAYRRLAGLAEEGNPTAAAALVEALGISEVASEAELALIELPSLIAVPALLPALDSDDIELRATAIRMLARRPSTQVAEALGRVYERPGEEENLKTSIRKALAKMRDYIDVETLLEVAREGEDRDQRARAIRLLGATGDPRADLLIQELLMDPDPFIQSVAALALADSDTRTALPKMRELRLSTDNPHLQKMLDAAIHKLER